MEPIPADAELSVRRSRVRRRVLLMVASLGEAYLSQLARACHLDRAAVKWALHGYPPRYSVDFALVPLGLVAERPATGGRVKYVVTTRGRRKARSLTARAVRGRRHALNP